MSVELNGYDVQALVAGAGSSSDDVEKFERAESTTLEGTTYARKRKWSFKLSPTMTDAELEAVRGWVQGNFWHWNFSRVDGATVRFNAYEDGGGVGWAATSGSITSTMTAKFSTNSAGYGLQVTSAGVASITLPFSGASGFRYSWGAWKWITANTHHWCAHTYDGVTNRYYSGVETGTALTTAFQFFSIGSASGYFSLNLEGQDVPGANAVAAYDGVFVAPFAMTHGQIDALAARTVPIPAPPYVAFDGGLNERLCEVVVKGFADSEDIEEVAYGGAVAHARMLSISLVER
jgi:hypothetical protein